MSSKLVVNTLGASNHSDEEREDLDFYQTPAFAVKSLISSYFRSWDVNTIWEPTAGNKAISKYFEADGRFKVISTDLVERREKLDLICDYFKQTSYPGYNKAYANADDFAVVMNPPYKLATEFMLHTLEVIQPKYFCVFLPIRYLEGKDRYKKIYSRYVPEEILTYSSRLGCYKDSDEQAGKVTDRGVASAVAYVWICFNRSNMRNPTMNPILRWL